MHSDSNPNLPGETIALRAYNLRPGAAFMVVDEPDPRVWVVERAAHDCDFERISIWAHDATSADLGCAERAFNLDFNTTVALVGLVVHEFELDDNDWGAEF